MHWRDSIRFEPPNRKHLRELKSWFSEQQALTSWGGPNMRQTPVFNDFVDSLNLENLSSFVMIEDDSMIGFGQYYLRLKHCHLGRLAIAPARRGQGLINVLVNTLAAKGCEQLQAQQVSLFVLEDNSAAINAYTKLGFRVTEYPEEPIMERCLYMTKPCCL